MVAKFYPQGLRFMLKSVHQGSDEEAFIKTVLNERFQAV